MIQTIVVAFSLKTSRACAGMLSYENDIIKVSKTAKNTNSKCVTCTIVPVIVELVFFFLNQSAVYQKHYCKCGRRAVFNIFQNIEILILVTFL